MTFCAECGKKLGQIEKFCSECGTNINGPIKEVKKEVEGNPSSRKNSTKKSNKKFFIGLFIICYLVLNMWALGQITPVITGDSILASVSNFDGDVSLGSSSASTTVRMKNPTIIPIITGGIVMDAGYGSNEIAKGKSGLIIMAPYSEKDIDVSLEVSHIQAGLAGIKGISNFFTGKDDDFYANIYVDMFLKKIKIKEFRK